MNFISELKKCICFDVSQVVELEETYIHDYIDIHTLKIKYL